MEILKQTSNSSIDSMVAMSVIGALNAYQFYGNILVKNPTQDVWWSLMKTAGAFIIDKNNYSPTSDADITALSATFKNTVTYDNPANAIATFPAFSTMWSGVKLNGLASKTTVNSWITTNYPNFDPAQFTTFRRNFFFNLYCDLFFMQMFSGPLSKDAEAYFPSSVAPASGKQAASAMLQMYSIYMYYDQNYYPATSPDTPPAFNSTSTKWPEFVKQANDYYQGMNLAQQGPNYTGFYTNLNVVNNAIVSLAIPDPYSNFRDYFSSILINNPNINGPFWTTLANWGNINSDLNGTQALLPLFNQFEGVMNGSSSLDDKYSQLTSLSQTLLTTANSYANLCAVTSVVSLINAIAKLNPTFGIYLPNGSTQTGISPIVNEPNTIGPHIQLNYAKFSDTAPLANAKSTTVTWLPNAGDQGFDQGQNQCSWSDFINNQVCGQDGNGGNYVLLMWDPEQNDPVPTYNFSNPQCPPESNCIFDTYINIPTSKCFVSSLGPDSGSLNILIALCTQGY